jgi:hypothetical protein
MGAFFFYGPASDWKQAAKSLPIAQAFSAQVVRETEAEFNINAFELAAIMSCSNSGHPLGHTTA